MNKKEKILKVAGNLFFKKGYQNTSLEEVASVLGYTRPAIYYYFKSKDEILQTIFENVLSRAEGYLENILSMDIPIDEKLKKIIEQHTLAILDNQAEMGIFFEEQKSLPASIIKDAVDRVHAYYDRITEIYQAGIEQGIFVDIHPPVALRIILGQCNWTYKWYSNEGAFTKEEISTLIDQLLESGYYVR